MKGASTAGGFLVKYSIAGGMVRRGS